MQVAPLIFSRMLYVDFNQNFSVRPSDLDTAWARSKINPSIRDVENLQGKIRRVVAAKNNICIAGISGNIEDIVKNISETLQADTEKFFRDFKGRKIKCFIGCVFKGEGVPAVSDKDLWNFFKGNMSKIWERETSETIPVDYKNFETESAVIQPEGSEKISNVICYGGGNDEKIWKWCIAQKLDFCSNVNQYDIFKDGKYKVIAASQNVINRLKNEVVKETPKEDKIAAPKIKEPVVTEKNSDDFPTQKKTQPNLKKPSNIPIAAAIAVILTATIIFLIVNH